MSNSGDFTLDAGTGNVLLRGELMRNKSCQELMDAAIYKGIDVRKVKNPLDIEQAITSYVMSLLCSWLPLADTTWQPPKRAKVRTPQKHWTLSVLR